MSVQTSTRMVAVTCDTCGSDLESTITIDGDHKTTLLRCVNPHCATPVDITEHFVRELVRAHVCGPGLSGGMTDVGYIWVASPSG